MPRYARGSPLNETPLEYPRLRDQAAYMPATAPLHLVQKTVGRGRIVSISGQAVHGFGLPDNPRLGLGNVTIEG